MSDSGALGLERPSTDEPDVGAEAGLYGDDDRLLREGLPDDHQLELPGRGLRDSRAGAAAGSKSRATNPRAAQAIAKGKGARPGAQRTGSADDRRLVCAVSGRGMGKEKDAKRPHGMARNQDRTVLSAGASR